MVVAYQDIAIKLVAEIAVVFHASHRIKVSYAGCVSIVYPVFFSSFVTHTSLDIQIRSYVPFDASAKFIAVTVGDRGLSVQHPIWITELLLLCICPVLDIAASCGIIHLEVLFIAIPVFSSREEINTGQRIP